MENATEHSYRFHSPINSISLHLKPLMNAAINNNVHSSVTFQSRKTGFQQAMVSDDEQHKHIFSGIMFLLFKENDLQFTKNEIKLNVKDEIIKPTWAVVNELNSHGGRMITCQDLGKMCK